MYKRQKQKYQKKGNVYLHAIHRLDRPVAGIVLFAKTSKALSRMNEAMRDGSIKKIYHAWVEGKLSGSGTLESRILHGDKKAVISPKGKLSTLHYQVIESQKNKTHVEVELVTGRYHQIRVQLAEIGHPILGDLKYGSTYQQKDLALTHVKMEFVHPVTGELTTLSSAS